MFGFKCPNDENSYTSVMRIVSVSVCSIHVTIDALRTAMRLAGLGIRVSAECGRSPSAVFLAEAIKFPTLYECRIDCFSSQSRSAQISVTRATSVQRHRAFLVSGFFIKDFPARQKIHSLYKMTIRGKINNTTNFHDG